MYARARLFVIGSVICALMPALRAQKGTSWLNELRQPCAKKYAVYQQQVLRTPSGLYQCLLIPVSGKDTLLRATYDHPSCKDMYRHGSFLFKENGQLRDSGNYFRGKPEGFVYKRLDQLPGYTLYGYKNGVLDGPCMARYTNGILADTFTMVEGKEQGTRLKYHPNGVLKNSITFDQGKRQGMQASWDSTGRLQIRSFYKDDMPDAFYERYGTSRNLSEKGSNRRNMRVGSWYFYRNNGSLASFERYNDSGRMVFVQHYDEQGKPQAFDSLRQNRSATPSGGMNAFYEAVTKEYQVPMAAVKQHQHALIELCFLVDEQGKPTKLKVCNEPHVSPILEQEAIRCFNALNIPWQAAWEHNRPVPVWLKLPIRVDVIH